MLLRQEHLKTWDKFATLSLGDTTCTVCERLSMHTVHNSDECSFSLLEGWWRVWWGGVVGG